MSVARSGAPHDGAAVTVRSMRLLVAAGLATLCLAFASAAAVPGRAEANSGTVCGGAKVVKPPGPRTARRAAPRVATGSALGFVGIAEWLGARAGTAIAEKSFLTGFEAVLRAAGQRNAGEQTLKQLGEIKGHLDEVSSQLGRVDGRLDRIAAAVHGLGFDNVLRPICVISRAQESLFLDFYEPMIDAGYKLAALEEGGNSWQADQPEGEGMVTPRERAEQLAAAFLEESRLRDQQRDFQTLHAALMPAGLEAPVLKAYGRVLMGKRTLTRADSRSLRDLYQELADLRAVATWMSEEYWSAQPAFKHLVKQRREALIYDGPKEEVNLPKMIPPGVVIDLGSGGAERVTGHPMWFAPDAKDLEWMPPFTVGAQWGGTIRNDELALRLERLNNHSFDPGAGYGIGWNVPTRRQFEALISEGCVVSRTDPDKFQDNVKCTNAVTPETGGTVAGYLYGLDADNATWRQLFCTKGCPASMGPDRAAFRHAFIWTRDIHVEKMTCGWEAPFFKTIIWSRELRTYTGFRTTAKGPEWLAFPELKGRPPERGRTAPEALNFCDAYVTKLLDEAPARNVELAGVLLATRYAGPSDLNPDNKLDYMAQG
jgi:hypothetical protein